MFELLETCLPLPKGEGWGEGEERVRIRETEMIFGNHSSRPPDSRIHTCRVTDSAAQLFQCRLCD